MNAQIYEEAANWFVELRAGDVDHSDRRKFDAWIRTSPEHLRAYLEITEIWQDAPFVGNEGDLSIGALTAHAHEEGNVLPLEVAASWISAVSGQSPAGRPRAAIAKAKPGGGQVRHIAIAASLLLVLAIGGASAWFITQRNAYATAIGEQRIITLEDGSTVQLNARSKIKIHFTERQRSIALLKGQALFSVAKNRARPFTVDTGTTRIRAVGTQFDVYKKRTGTIVTVIEGRVAVARDTYRIPRGGDDEAENSSPAPQASEQDKKENTLSPLRVSGEQGALWEGEGEVLLAAGEQVTVTPAALPQPKKASIATATAWTQRRLIFDDSPLPEVVEEFNRYNTRQFIIADSHLSEFHISGVYASTDPEFLLRFLRAQAWIEINETDAEIRISRK